MQNNKPSTEIYTQLELFPEAESSYEDSSQKDASPAGTAPSDPRPPITVTWNGWHGCTKVSAGCQHCYMFRRDESVGRDPKIVRKTQSFGLPVRKLRSGPHKGLYKIPEGSLIYTCFSSDFFHEAADDWREEAWDMMRERRDCTFFMITKRPERITDHLPADWDWNSDSVQEKHPSTNWDHVHIAVTCESQSMANRRLPVYLRLPLHHKSVMVEPMLGPVNLQRFFREYPGAIESVSVGGESGPDARPCDYAWVLDLHLQCVANDIAFSYHQTGARLIKNGRLYEIPRNLQHSQAALARLDWGITLPQKEIDI